MKTNKGTATIYMITQNHNQHVKENKKTNIVKINKMRMEVSNTILRLMTIEMMMSKNLVKEKLIVDLNKKKRMTIKKISITMINHFKIKG